MEIMSYTFLRNKLASVMNEVCENHSPIVVTRQEQKPVVIMSLEDYNSIEESIYLLSNPKNAERLKSAVDDFKTNDNFTRVSIE